MHTENDSFIKLLSSSFRSLKSLKYFDIHLEGNHLHDKPEYIDSLGSELQNLPSLEKLSLGYDDILDLKMESFRNRL